MTTRHKKVVVLDRRDFLRLLVSAGAAALAGCSMDGKSRAYPYQVDLDVCRGCQRCIGKCSKEAILLERKSSYTVIRDKCTGCGTCQKVCPYGAAKLGEDFISRIDPATCQLCGTCYGNCAYKAIKADLFTARIDQNACVHCGECVELAFCPWDAIYSTYI